MPGVEALGRTERDISLNIVDADLEFDLLRNSKQKVFNPVDISFAK